MTVNRPLCIEIVLFGFYRVQQAMQSISVGNLKIALATARVKIVISKNRKKDANVL